jgi:hypothetical protein
VQLTLELKDRNRWEVLRMHEMIKAHDNDVEQKFQKLLREQAEHFEEELLAETEKAARKAARTSEDNVRSELVHEYSLEMEKLRESFQAQLEQTVATLQAEREKEVADAHKQAEAAIVSEKEKAMANLARAQARIRALEDSSAMRARNSVEAVRMLKVTAALFDLLEHKDAREALDPTLKALAKASKGDKTIAKSLSAIPERVYLVGVPSIADLSTLFSNTVRNDCVRMALTQPDGNMMTVSSIVCLCFVFVVCLTDGWMDAWMDAWMDGLWWWLGVCVCVCVCAGSLAGLLAAAPLLLYRAQTIAFVLLLLSV